MIGLTVTGTDAGSSGIRQTQFATHEVRMLQGEHGLLWERRILEDRVQFLARLGLAVMSGDELAMAVGVINVPVDLGSAAATVPAGEPAWSKLALELFPGARGMTESERAAHQAVQRRLFKPSSKIVKRTR